MRLDIDEWILNIRSMDPITFENAYFGTRPQGPEVVARLILELQASKDPYTRGKFCELLGETGDKSVIPVLMEELQHAEESVRTWATLALDELQSETRRAAKAKYLHQFKTDPQ